MPVVVTTCHVFSPAAFVPVAFAGVAVAPVEDSLQPETAKTVVIASASPDVREMNRRKVFPKKRNGWWKQIF